MSGKLCLNEIIHSEQEIEDPSLRGVFLWDPRLKLALLLGIIVLNIGLAINWLSALLLVSGMVLIFWSKPPFVRTVSFFLAPLLAVLVAFAGYSVGFGETPVYRLGSIVVFKEGVTQGIGVALRVYCDMAWLVLTFITTPFPKILEALHWYKMPSILLDTLGLMYRYSFLLFEEFIRMYTAALSRGGRADKWQTIHTVSRIGAQIFMRTFDRSERIYIAMFARGGERDDYKQR